MRLSLNSGGGAAGQFCKEKTHDSRRALCCSPVNYLHITTRRERKEETGGTEALAKQRKPCIFLRGYREHTRLKLSCHYQPVTLNLSDLIEVLGNLSFVRTFQVFSLHILSILTMSFRPDTLAVYCAENTLDLTIFAVVVQRTISYVLYVVHIVFIE